MQFLSPEHIAEFSEKGFIVIDNWLPDAVLRNVHFEFDELFRSGKFKKAQITHGRSEQPIRADWTFWLEKDLSPGLKGIQKTLNSWLPLLNENFYCGVTTLEAHLAHYPPGPGYQKHVDQPLGKGNRVLTFVLYLNPVWNDTDGGQLCLYGRENEKEKRIEKISPMGGRLVIFRSELFPHEVLPSQRPRRSLTGWFRNDAVL
jgi:SM-20-related protein